MVGDDNDVEEPEGSVERTDYRYADGRFTKSPRAVTVSNHNYLSSSETRVNAGTRRWNLHISEST
jgi:hypothetical protein